MRKITWTKLNANLGTYSLDKNMFSFACDFTGLGVCPRPGGRFLLS